jgi:hypothetical protein
MMKFLERETPSSWTPYALPPTVMLLHAPSVPGAEPTGAGGSSVAGTEAEAGSTQGEAGGEGPGVVNGYIVALYGKEDEPPPAHDTSEDSPALTAGIPNTLRPRTEHVLRNWLQAASQSCGGEDVT